MTATVLFDVRDALVSIFGAAVTPAPVFHGPRPRSASPKQYVLVGSDGGDTGVGEATDDGMTADQSLSDLGPGTWRDEKGEIICSAWAWTGNSTFDASTTAARALHTACAGAVAADRTLAGLLQAPGLAELGSVAVRESLLTTGPTVRITFTVAFGALITT